MWSASLRRQDKTLLSHPPAVAASHLSIQRCTCRVHTSASAPKYWRVLVDGSEGVPEVEVRDVAAEDDAGDAREAVVQACPESGVDDLVAELVWHVGVSQRVR